MSISFKKGFLSLSPEETFFDHRQHGNLTYFVLFYKNFLFQILAAMRKELANSGLSEEEILAKTMLLQKALSGDNSPAFVNKTIKSALSAANISPNDLAKVKIFFYILENLDFRCSNTTSTKKPLHVVHLTF